MIYQQSYKLIILVLSMLLITACGGGGTSAGPSAPAPVAAPKVFNVGVYAGELMLTLSNDDFPSDGPSTTRLILRVAGVAGSQQVSIAFAQFSGSSSIGLDGDFTIPSGQFRIRIVDPDTGRTNSTCQGNITFDGKFVGDSVSGTIMGEFNCPFSRTPLIASGDFSADFGATKQTSEPSDLDFLFDFR